jgi:hypothetical protein
MVVTGCGDKAKTTEEKRQTAKAEKKAAVEKQPPSSATEESRPVPQEEATQEQSAKKGDEVPAASADIKKQTADASDGERVTALKPPQIRPAVMPEVNLSAAHAGKCFVRVGDEFPEFSLSDLTGKSLSFADVHGESLTVIVLWSADRILADEQLRFLEERIGRYADLGVRRVAINVGDAPDRVRAVLDPIEKSYANLLDPDGRLLMRVGQDHLPRTYLLDREGRVLWFDIEFSRQTREQLEQAIHASLKAT